jgi:uncharacterized pyridoxal phosphate-containing UPF0001 family protein
VAGALSAETVSANLADVRARIEAAGGDPARVRVVAVTKTFGPDAVRAAAAAGITAVGENYVAELEEKRAACFDLDLRWHFLGALQGNKVARAAAAADVLCAVSRAVDLERVARARAGAEIYLEVDLSGVAGRPGAPPEALGALVARGRELGLRVEGIMTVAPPDPEGARRAFATAARLADEWGLAERSMGMSDDLELAVAAGTTEVRVGRALFGPRGATAALA